MGVVDLMIRYDDIVLGLVTSDQRIDTIGVPVLTEFEDIANAITFKNGCVCNLTASHKTNRCGITSSQAAYLARLPQEKPSSPEDPAGITKRRAHRKEELKKSSPPLSTAWRMGMRPWFPEGSAARRFQWRWRSKSRYGKKQTHSDRRRRSIG
jgi:hypothetical protein